MITRLLMHRERFGGEDPGLPGRRLVEVSGTCMQGMVPRHIRWNAVEEIDRTQGED